MRRSARAAKARAEQPVLQSGSGEDEDDDIGGQESGSEEQIEEEEESLDGADSSADEWRPEVDARKGKRRRGGERGRGGAEEVASDEDSEEVSGGDESVDDEDLAVVAPIKKSKTSKKRGRVSGITPITTAASSSSSRTKQPKKQKRVSKAVEDAEILAAQAAIEAEEEAERLELQAAQVEAAEAWQELRKRKQQQQAQSQDASGKDEGKGAGKNDRVKSLPAPAASLTSWLSIPDPEWPTTCADAMINDRDSLFVGYVYTLTTPSLSTISQMLSHLGKQVHPKTVPTDRLPPSMQHLPTNRRGAMHDMHAWRCLALKVGRTGLNGPEDFGLEEGMDDDGEKYGAEKISRVIKQLGATDVLVVVSRWYGGTLLGPVRFQHIADCARAALSQYMIDEALVPLKDKLKSLDDRVRGLRLQLNPGMAEATVAAPPSYDNLDLAKIERLIAAREKGVEMLEKRLKAIEGTAAVPAEAQQAAATAATAAAGIQDAPAEVHNIAQKEVVAEQEGTTEIGVAGHSNGNEALLVKEEEADGVDLTGWDALE